MNKDKIHTKNLIIKSQTNTIIKKLINNTQESLIAAFKQTQTILKASIHMINKKMLIIKIMSDWIGNNKNVTMKEITFTIEIKNLILIIKGKAFKKIETIKMFLSIITEVIKIKIILVILLIKQTKIFKIMK